MPINKSLLDNLMANNGDKKGQSIYFGLENKGTPAFKKGLKTAQKEGHTVAHLKNIKKKKSKGVKHNKAFNMAMKDQKAIAGIKGDLMSRMTKKK